MGVKNAECEADFKSVKKEYKSFYKASYYHESVGIIFFTSFSTVYKISQHYNFLHVNFFALFFYTHIEII